MERTSYPPGTPNWVDVTSPDIHAAARFYCDLFGWNATDLGEEFGNYHMFDLDGETVAAGSPSMMGEASPPAWTSYFSVVDADTTLEAIENLGGSVLMPGTDVAEAGRMGIARDPLGGVFAVWQPGTTVGAQIVNVPGAWCWNELTTRNADELLMFYTAIFGWTIEKLDSGGFVYREIQLDGRRVAGCMEMDENWPPDLPTHWMVYFAVDDADAAAQKVTELGGSVHMPPTDIPVGRFAVVQDPTGATFSVIKLDRADD
jgi:predicted enzyme related to lactoylglutathione lyase